MGRYAKLVDTLEARVVFRAQYRILNSVEIQHCEYGEWMILNWPPESMVILIIVFIEGGIKLPMRRVTKDFLINYKLVPIHCSPNVFRVLRCVDMLNKKIGTNLTWHNVNWVYNCQKGERTKYYIKYRVPAIRLISCLPGSSKSMDEDFLIVSGD